MAGMDDTSSVAFSRVSHASHKSIPGARARAFLFIIATNDVHFDPPKLPADLEEKVTYACGQLVLPPTVGLSTVDDESSSGSGSDSESSSDSSDTEEDDEVLKNPVHFTGYVEFTEQVSTTAVRAWLGPRVVEIKAAFVKDRDLHIRNRTDADKRFKSKIDLILRAPWQIGKGSRSSQGARTDFEAIREILREHGPEEGIRIVAEKFPGQFIRYASGITQLAQAIVPKVRETAEFKCWAWQAALISILKTKPHSRHIYWVEDPLGGAGKSRLTTYLCREMNAIELDGRMADAAFSYNGQPIVLFDLARACDTGTLKDLYAVAEKLKNGTIFSSKYQSRQKMFTVPHVVYFSNSAPPIGMWSADRLQHILLSDRSAFKAVSEDGAVVEDDVPEVDGAAMFARFLEEEKAKAVGKKRARDDGDDD